MSRISGSSDPSRNVRLPTAAAETPKADAQKPAAPESAARNVAQAVGFSATSAFASAKLGASTGVQPQAQARFTPLSPNDLGVMAQNQGNTNACGTTSLANVMTYWGMPRTHEQIDSAVRPFDLFSAPDKLVEYARDNGLRAELKNDATLDDIVHAVDQGTPPIVLVDPDSDNNMNLHYMTVTGYNRDANGKVDSLVIADSAGGYRYTMPAEKFQQQWDNLKMENIGIGLNNVMITTAPADGRMVKGGDGVSRSASELQLPKSSLWSDLRSGLTRGLASAIGTVGKVAEKAVEAAKVVGNAVADAAKAVGGAVASAANAVADVASRAWNWLTGG